MTVWERISLLVDEEPTVLFQNWGPNLDGASLVTALAKVGGRDVAIYGHDFTVRAGSMDATNGSKLAQLFETAGKLGIPVIGLNDSPAPTFLLASVALMAMLKLSERCERSRDACHQSCVCSDSMRAADRTCRAKALCDPAQYNIFWSHWSAVIKSVLGEDVTPDELGGPNVHSQTGVTDFVVEDEVQAIRKVRRLLRFLPSNNETMAPFQSTSDRFHARHGIPIFF